jgi:hypothetical protein
VVGDLTAHVVAMVPLMLVSNAMMATIMTTMAVLQRAG